MSGNTLDTFHRLRRILDGELGIVPAAELRLLHQAILRHSPELAWHPQQRDAAGPAGYFGREPEMTRLTGFLEKAAAGRGGVVLLAGEPGIGKSHALRQLIDRARADSAVVLTGRCIEGAWVPPFHPFAEAIAGYGETAGPERLRADLGAAGAALARITPRLAQLLPDLGPLPALQPDEERFRLLDAAAQFFTALSGRATVLLVLDDLQWADTGTAMMMRHVARSCGLRRLLIAGAYRTTETAREDLLSDMLGAMQPETECATIRLRALGAEAVGQLLAAEAGAPVSPSLVTAIGAHTGGNPFFAKEVIRHLAEERALRPDGSGELETSLPLVAVPEGVRQVLARRRARVSAAANRLLECGSGFAGPFLFPVDDIPEPEVPGPDDVIVRIGGAGLCRTDLHIIDGWFADAIPADLPVVLGHENAGWVHAVGPAVEHLAVGDPVICHPNLTCGVCGACRAGDDMRCARGPRLPGLMGAGGMAELFKTRARAVVKLGAGAEPAEVAALADAGVTAYHAVRKAVPGLGAGSSAVAVGIGGLGHIGIQCLKAMTPASVIAVDTSEEALKLAVTLGADHAVRADGQQAQQVRDLAGPGADAVFDFVGEDSTIGDSVAMLRPGGTYYLVGYGGTVTLPTMQLVLGEITLAANLIGTYTDLVGLVTLAGQGQVVLHSSRYPLEAANDAIDDLRHGRIHGRAVLVPG